MHTTYGRGTYSSPQVTLHYSGTSPFSRTAFSTSSPSDVTIGFPAPLSGSYQLDAVELSDAGGNTIYFRDGKITRSLYASGALPTTHSINLAAGDFSVGGTPSIARETGRAINLSTRGFVGTGDQAMIVGIAVSNGRKSFLFRAIGPTLSNFGVDGAVGDPKIELRNARGEIVTQNDQWSPDLAQTSTSVGAFPLPSGSRDAALRATLDAGNYSLVITSADGGTGVALAEAYELP